MFLSLLIARFTLKQKGRGWWSFNHSSSALLFVSPYLVLLSFRYCHGDGACLDVAVAVRGGHSDGVDAARAAS